MFNLVNSVANSMISAASQMKMAGVAVGVYESAKARGDTGIMERALSYATPAISDALKHGSDIGDDLKAAQKQAREQAAKEAENARREEAQKNEAEKAAAGNDATAQDQIEGSTVNPNAVAVSAPAQDVYVSSDNTVVSTAANVTVDQAVSGSAIDVQA